MAAKKAMVHRRRFLKIYSLKFCDICQSFYFYRILKNETFKMEIKPTNFVANLIVTIMVYASHGRYVHAGNFSPIIRSQYISRLQGLFGGSLLIPETLFLELSAANSIPDHYGIFFLTRSCAVRFAALFTGKFSREISHYVGGFQFAHKSFHRCALCFLFVFFLLF